MTMATKPILHLTGPHDWPPSLDDLVDLYVQLTGKTPTPEQLAEAQARFAKIDQV